MSVKDSYDFTEAAKDGDLSTVQKLVDVVNVNFQENDGCTALWNAAWKGHMDVVQFLVSRKDVDVNLANVRTKDCHHMILTCHYRLTSISQLRFLILTLSLLSSNLFRCSLCVFPLPTFLCLLFGCLSHFVSMLLLLHDPVFFPYIYDPLYSLIHTQLHRPLYSLKPILVPLIPYLSPHYYISTPHYYISSPHQHLSSFCTLHDICFCFLQNDSSSPLHVAASCGHDSVVTVLLTNGADANQANNNETSPLYIAAANGKDSVVAVLLTKGADVNQVTKRGLKPIDITSNQNIKDMLIAHTNKQQPSQPRDQAPFNSPKVVDGSEWFQAAEKGDLAVIQQGINDKIDVNCRDSEGRTAVYWASRNNHAPLVEYLISRHADLRISNVSADNVILSSFKLNPLRPILTHYNPTHRSICYLQNYGDSPLNRAAGSGHDAMSALLLSNGADVNQANNDGWSPLYTAACNGSDAIVAVLLSNGADVNQAKNDGWSPLYEAALDGHHAVVAVLLSNGADVNQADNSGQKPIDVAKNQEVKDMLIAHTNKQQQPQSDQAPFNSPKVVNESQWFQAAEKGDLAVIQQGINDKIDVNCRDSEGRTAVYWAARKGHVQLVEYLISLHSDLSIANVSAYDVYLSISILTTLPPPIHLTPLPHILILLLQNFGDAPLHMAALKGHHAVAAALLSNGAVVDRVNSFGRSPLYIAAATGHDDVVALLLSNGADANQAYIHGQLPIDVSHTQNIKDMLLFAQMKKKHQESQQPVDESLWYYAAMMGDLALVQQGIHEKIDVNGRNGYGCTAMWLAAWKGHLRLVEYLISQHSDLNVVSVSSACYVYWSISMLTSLLPILIVYLA